MKLRLIIPSLLSFCMTAQAVADNSATREQLVKLPTAGGTVTKDESQVTVQENKGAVNFALPLPQLPQRGRLKPSLALAYNQFQGSNGNGLGNGWAFDVGSIEINEDKGTPIRGQKADGRFYSNFTFKGKRLVFVAKLGDGRIEFAPESGSEPIRIYYTPSSLEVLLLNRFASIDSRFFSNSFDVYYPDGTREIYSGNAEDAEGDFTANPVFIQKWPLRLRMMPVSTTTYDAIEYTYTKAGGRSYLKSASFGGGVSRYEFDSTQETDGIAPNVSFKNSFEQSDPLLYTRVRAIFDGQELNQWCFAYQVYNPNTHAFRIVTHENCSTYAHDVLRSKINTSSLSTSHQLLALFRFGGGVHPLAADSARESDIFFHYSDWNDGDLILENQGIKADERPLVYNIPLDRQLADSLDDRLYTLADFNQDSLVDLVYNGSDATRVFLGDGRLTDSFQRSVDWSIEGSSKGPDFSRGEFQFADLNGDSFVDVLRFDPTDHKTITLYLGDGRGHYDRQARTLTIADPASGQQVTVDDLLQNRGELIDINLDGTTDYVGTYRRSGNLFLMTCYSRVSPVDGQPAVRFLCRSSNFPVATATDFPLSSPDFRLADLNGDSLPDLVQFKDDSSIKGYCVFPNNGNLYATGNDFVLFGSRNGADAECGGRGRFFQVQGLGATDLMSNMWFVDVNGDGINDLVKVVTSTMADLQVWLGLGNGSFASNARRIKLNASITLGTDQNRQVKIADIDADGQKEILLLNQGEQNPIRVIDFNRVEDEQLPKSNLLTSVEYESGLRHDFRYATSSDEYIRDLKALEDNILDREPISLHFPAVVLKQHTISEGRVGELRQNVEVTEYVFHDPYFHPEDRRFQGFGSVEAIKYGDEINTEGSSLVRSVFYTGRRLEQRHLAGELKEKFIFEFTPHDSYQLALKNSQAINPKSAVLHTLSNYARTQAYPCGTSNGQENYQHCQLRSRSLIERTVVPAAAPDVYLTQTTTEQNEAISPLPSDFAKSCSPLVTDRTARMLTIKTTSYTSDGSNLPRETLTNEKALQSPFGVHIPEKSLRQTLSYAAPVPGLNILNNVEREEEYSWQEGESGEKLTALSVNEYDPNSGWLTAKDQTTYSSLQNVPAEVQDLWQDSNTVRTTLTHDVFGNIKNREIGNFSDGYVYSDDGLRVLETIDSLGFSTRIGADAKGRMSTITDPRGLVNTFHYDDLNRMTSATTSLGYEETYRYRVARNFQPSMIERKRLVKSEWGGATRWAYTLAAYDSQGRELASFDEHDIEEGASKKTAVRVIALKEFNRKGSPVAEYTPFVSTFDNIPALFASGFDLNAGGLQNRSGVSGNALAKSKILYDHFGQQTSMTSPIGTVSNIQYFAWGRVTHQAYRASRNASEKKNSCQISVTRNQEIFLRRDELGFDHRFTYDARGSLQSIRLAGESQARDLTFDSAGLLEFQRTPGVRSEYKIYDDLGQPTHRYVYDRSNSFQHAATISYDKASRPLKQTADGQDELVYAYDSYSSAERDLIRGIAPDALENPKGLLTRVKKIDPNGLYDFEVLIAYDTAGRTIARRVVVQNRMAGLFSPKEQIFTETLGYGPDGTMLFKKDPFGVESRLKLSSNQLTAGADLQLPWAPGTWETVIAGIQYNPKGQLQGIDYRQGLKTRLGYEPATLLLSEIKSYRNDRLELQDLSLDFDGKGNLVEVIDSLPSELWGRLNRSARYTYNAREELIRSEWTKMRKENGYDLIGTPTADFSYSGAGNTIKNSDYAAGNWLVQSFANTNQSTGLLPLGTSDKPLVYDSLGQLKSNGKVRNTRFDAAGQLICAETAEHIVYFGYDQTGRRFYKKVVPLSAGQTCPVKAKDEAGRLSFYPTAGSTVEPTGNQSFVFAGDHRLARVEHGGKRWFFYLKDHLQSSDVIIAADGTPVEQMIYKPYGGELDNGLSFKWKTHTEGAAAGKLPLEPTHHRFTGHYLDADTGLYYMNARYYDANAGRFVSPDPLFLGKPVKCLDSVIECNLYSYAGNNPMSRIDPTGLDWLLYDGTKVSWYGGKSGDTSSLKYTFKATSGLKHPSLGDWQMAKYQDIKDAGPLPEAKYSMNLKPDPNRVAKANPKNGELVGSAKGGQEQIPASYTTPSGDSYSYPGWGNKRIALDPKSGDMKGRGSFYVHDSHKGFTHGCVEIESSFFDKLEDFRKANPKTERLEFQVDYADGNTVTNGGTKK